MNLENNLKAVLLDAVEICKHPVEEEGGIILQRNNDYMFVYVLNIFRNTPTAAGLYETEQDMLATDVFPKLAEGWRFYASFHTHPSFSPTPSNLDLTALFQGFKHNFIYAPKLNEFSYTTWINNESQTTTYFNL
jgi:proteasome lid subunit RPN8/RPN11